MTTDLPYTDCHMGLHILVESCRSMTSTGIWERIWGSAEFFVQIYCEDAEGPDEFFTKSYKRNKKIAINENFTFVLPDRFLKIGEELSKPLAIHITLYKNSQKFGTTNVDITEVELLQKQNITIDFTLNQEILMLDFEFKKRHVTQPDFRYSLKYSDEETEALSKRKKRVFEHLKSLLPDMKISGVEDVPSIAVVCSGGGYRSTTQFCGAMEAIMESGLLNCTSYLGGLSGGSWYLLPAYVKKALKDTETLLNYHSEIKLAAKSSLIVNSLTDITHYMRYRTYAKSREVEGQPITFVDFYGYSVARTFMGYKSINTKLSEVSEYAGSGEVPIPIITSLHTKSKVPSAEFCSDLEITPWEASLPHYGINIPIEKFGSEWYKGSIVRSCPEYPLHYFLGASSIALGILLKYYLKGETTEADKDFVEDVRKHEFGRHKTKRESGTRRKEDAAELSRRLRLFSRHARDANIDHDTDSVFQRQKSRSSTRRMRTISEQQHHATLLTIPDETDQDVPVQGEPLSDAGVHDQNNSVTMSPGQAEDGSTAQRLGSGTSLTSGVSGLPAEKEATPDDKGVMEKHLLKTFRRRTCRFSSATSEYDTAEEEDEDGDIFPATDVKDPSSNKDSNNKEPSDAKKDMKDGNNAKLNDKPCSPYLLSMLKRISKHPLFTDREAIIDRTAKAFNVARGFTGVKYHHLNPEHKVTNAEQRAQNISTTDDVITFVDPAIICNVPCNALLRRKVDVLIVCDATEYKSDTDIDYLELFLSESIAKKQGLKFPKIDPQKLKDNPRGIAHVFEDENDPECPIIIWFTLCNKQFKAQENVPLPARRTMDDDYKLPPNELFNVFSVYGPKSPYQTLNTRYTPLQFDRLRALMKHSLSSNMEMIKCQIIKKICQRQRFPRKSA